MSGGVEFTFDASEVMANLDKLGEGIKRDLVRPAAQAGAQVIYDAVKAFVPVGKAQVYRKYKIKVEGGTLRDSIYQAFSKDNSDATKSEYHISWNHLKAPHGHLVEYGTSRWVGHPFLRPAYEAYKAAAYDAAVTRLETDFAALVQKL